MKTASAVDLITVELVENALRGVGDEMDAVVWNTAMSPIIREQHDAFPLVTNERGQMLVGQFGSYVPYLLDTYESSINDGDVLLQSDPYMCEGAIQHTPDWLVLVPIDYEGERIGYASMFGHMLDVGGAVPGSMATEAKSIGMRAFAFHRSRSSRTANSIVKRSRSSCGIRGHRRATTQTCSL